MITALQERFSTRALWWILGGFLALNGALLALEIFYLPVLPVLLLFFVLAFVSLDRYLLVIVFFAPLSIPLSVLAEGLSIDMYLPTEPMLAALLLFFILKYLRGERLDLKVLRHPVSLAIYFHLAWMFLTALTSTDILVSMKFFASRLWFIVGFYFLAIELFRKELRMHRWVWLFTAAFVLVIIYTLVVHSQYGLNNQMMAHRASAPFYKDHTSYGATLGFILPVLVGMFLLIRKEDFNNRFLMALLLILVVMATVFSYTRATWVSLIGALGVFVLVRLRIRFEFVLVGLVVFAAFFMSIRTDLMIQMEQNRVESSGEFSEHVQSISNISTDQSNLERINRWSCAWRMWKDKPVFGFGPGTYQFEYGRYQRSYEKTRISTDFGTRGNAHSEYLGPLSESGLLGFVSIALVIGLTIMTGLRVYFRARKRSIKIFSLAVLLGLMTYYAHGVLNNFLDTDKISVLFWGFTAMLVAMDVYHSDAEETGQENAPEVDPSAAREALQQ